MAGAKAAGAGAGYLTSAAIFAGATAMWAVIVRDDPYYRLIDILGARVPLTMLIYLVAMPFAGFLIGRWRYHAPHRGGAIAFAGKLIARAVHFTYAHTLIVLFTLAMAMDYFLGLNIDEQVRSLDDRMFDVAARFAPWLCAYLAGFNLGRATRKDPAVLAETAEEGAATAFGEPAAGSAAVGANGRKKRGRKTRAEPVLADTPFLPGESADRGDLALSDAGDTPPLTSSGLPHAPVSEAAPAEAATGFLPPQDLNRLRPTLRELR